MTTELMLLLAGALHFTLLPVGLAVPRVLKWKEALDAVDPFSRRIILVHGAFVVGTIIAFGVLSLVMGASMPPALAAFIGLFWLGRLAVQLFYYPARLWPKAWWVTLGRHCLTLLFAILSAVYLYAAAR